MCKSNCFALAHLLLESEQHKDLPVSYNKCGEQRHERLQKEQMPVVANKNAGNQGKSSGPV